MKKFSLILSFIIIAVLFVSCEKNDIENETEFELKTIDKGDVTPPGGQSSNIQGKIDKGDVTPPGGQFGN
ncbi:hypothetical protein [Aquimarina algiphila]|uniref:hypothetical protein n=1 Tax=Aquimarina algiphila TaxID=2047982 RepID=UPI00232CDD7F|nr:hypothetical protein [Aquimarina algiphila]